MQAPSHSVDDLIIWDVISSLPTCAVRSPLSRLLFTGSFVSVVRFAEDVLLPRELSTVGIIRSALSMRFFLCQSRFEKARG